MSGEARKFEGLFPDDEEINQFLDLVEAEVGPELLRQRPQARLLMESVLRFSALARCLRMARDEFHGLSVSAVAKTLAVPKGEIENMESSGLPDMSVLLRYVRYLGLDDYYRAWREANPILAKALEVKAAESGILANSDAYEAIIKSEGEGELPPFPMLNPSASEPEPLVLHGEIEPEVVDEDSGEAMMEPAGMDGLLQRFAEQFLPDLPPPEEQESDSGITIKNEAPPATCQFKVTLKQIKPPVWRRFRVSNQLTLEQLHQVLQEVMDWTDTHLHEFVVNGTSYGVPEGEYEHGMSKEWEYRLRDLDLRKKSKFNYVYDFGDDWRHELVLEEILPPAPDLPPVCIKGARACPPEDCGGPWRYGQLVKIIADKKHPDPEGIREWIGRDFDPEAFDVDAINRRLASLSSEWQPKAKKQKHSRRS